MDVTDKRALRLVEHSDSERVEFIDKHYRKQRQQLNCAGCLIALIVSAVLWTLAGLMAYQLFLWLRY